MAQAGFLMMWLNSEGRFSCDVVVNGFYIPGPLRPLYGSCDSTPEPEIRYLVYRQKAHGTTVIRSVD